MLHPQLTLKLGSASLSSFESYFASEANANAAACVKAFCTRELDEQQLFLWGSEGVGKTHLLSAACQDLSARGFQVAYLTGELANNDEALAGVETADLFCLDNLQDIEAETEEPLFHTINRCRETGTRLLFAARPSVDELLFGLPDLITRLSWGAVFQLHALEDVELPDALNKLFTLRGLSVNDDVIEYILRRYPRDMVALMALLDKLDQASMVEKRRVTIPLVRELS